MKKIWTLLLVIGIILSAAITHANPGVKESFYRNCIDLRIKNCDLKAELLNSKYQHIRQWALRSSEEAKFYRDRKEQLIQALVQQNVEEKPYKVDYFLIRPTRTMIIPSAPVLLWQHRRQERNSSPCPWLSGRFMDRD